VSPRFRARILRSLVRLFHGLQGYSSALCFLTLFWKNWKEKTVLGTAMTSQNIVNEKKIQFSTRTPEEITIKFRCIRSVTKKATICFIMSACQLARPREAANFTVDRLLYYTYLLTHSLSHPPTHSLTHSIHGAKYFLSS
jgi:hypothetical protein